MTKNNKNNNETDADSVFFCLIYIIMWSKILCSSLSQLDFQIKQGKRRATVEMGNATQQLGANWRDIHYCCRGNLSSMGKKCSYLIGGARGSVFSGRGRSTLWSRKGLHRSPEIANKRMNFWVARGAVEEFTEQFTSWFPQTWFVSWIQEEGHLEKIYIHISPQHYLLHWNLMIPLIFNSKTLMFRSPRQTYRQKHWLELPSISYASV